MNDTTKFCSGLYYRFWDGWKMKKYEVMFWLDVFAALPIELINTTDEQDFLHIANTVTKSLKIWKVSLAFSRKVNVRS